MSHGDRSTLVTTTGSQAMELRAKVGLGMGSGPGSLDQEERIQGNMEAFEGIQIVKERKRDDPLVAPD